MRNHIDDLIKQLESDDLSICRDASIKLGDIADTRAVEPLIRLIEREPRVGYYAIESLGIIGDKQALGFLERISSEDEFLDKIARVAIKKIINSNDGDIVDAKKNFAMGVECEEQDDTENALKYYLSAIQKHPQYAEAHFNIGNIYLNLERKKDAANAFKRCIESVDGDLPDWLPYLYRAKKTINEVEPVNAVHAIATLKAFFEKYNTQFNTPGKSDTSDLKEYVLCIYEVGFTGSDEAEDALMLIESSPCYAEISMAVDLALEYLWLNE